MLPGINHQLGFTRLELAVQLGAVQLGAVQLGAVQQPGDDGLAWPH